MRKTVVQQHYSCSVQKTAGKNTQYSRNETILKIGHLAKAVAFAEGGKGGVMIPFHAQILTKFTRHVQF